MASSFSVMANLAAALGTPPTEKLNRDNHLFWKTQVLPALRGAQVMGLLDGSDSAPSKTAEVENSEKEKKTISNPDYEVWHACDQAVMGWLVKSMSQDILAQVVGQEHASEVWATVEDLFSSQSRAKVNMLRGALSNTRKGDLTADVYITKMKGFVSELAAAGKIVDDDELKGHILNGLDGLYNALVTSVNAIPSTTLNDMCSQLQAYDYRQNMLAETGQNLESFQTLANNVSRQSYYNNRYPSPPRGGYGRRDGGNYGRQEGRDGGGNGRQF
jgi:hypothetical protein